MAEMTEKQVNQYAMFIHLGGISWIIGIFLGNIIVPLILWQLKKDISPIIDKAGKDVLNFQISILIYLVGASLLTFIFIGFLIVPVLLIANIVFPIIAGLKANAGEEYPYPLTIKFIS